MLVGAGIGNASISNLMCVCAAHARTSARAHWKLLNCSRAVGAFLRPTSPPSTLAEGVVVCAHSQLTLRMRKRAHSQAVSAHIHYPHTHEHRTRHLRHEHVKHSSPECTFCICMLAPTWRPPRAHTNEHTHTHTSHVSERHIFRVHTQCCSVCRYVLQIHIKRCNIQPPLLLSSGSAVAMSLFRRQRHR